MISKSANSQENDSRGIPIERAFMKTFLSIRRKLNFTSAPVSQLADQMLFNLIQASTSKCVEFNIEANRVKSRTESTFILVSNLRGICEDLIYLTYLSKMDTQSANESIKLLIQQNIDKAFAAQSKFFELNNPYQPVLGKNISRQEATQNVRESKKDLRDFWKSMKCPKRDGPNCRDMAEEVGLISTYEFIYYAASNFVHFNPQSLLRTGWGDASEEDFVFKFSTRNMSGYYQSFSSFYAAVLFIGYEASFGSKYFNNVLDVEIAQLIKIIKAFHRWPEIVTFEEMNIKPPLFLLTHALRMAFQEEEENAPYGEIFKEILNLKS